MPNKDDSFILVLTGFTGTGKSTFLLVVQSQLGDRFHLVDGLKPNHTDDILPSASVNVLALDHVSSMANPKKTCGQALVWAKENNAIVILVDTDRRDFHAAGVDLPEVFLGVELHGHAGEKGVSLTWRNEERRYDRALLLAELKPGSRLLP